MLGSEGLQGHLKKQIATWWRNWFSPKMTAWCIIWLHAVRVLDRDNLQQSHGRAPRSHRAALSTFWLCACQGSSRQDPWGKKFLFDPDIELLTLPHFPLPPALPNRQTRLFVSSIIMNRPGGRPQQFCAPDLCRKPLLPFSSQSSRW